MQHTAHTHCLRCRRPLHSARSQSLGYGPTCARRIRNAARTADLTAYDTRQLDSARELIEDAAIIPLRNAVFTVVSTDGTETYLAHPAACTCPAGLKAHPGRRPCYHTAAARMLLAA
ncbi:DUF6011 domain-containing protein [Streptomyces kronopolitis]|uniref:DUF6011 domain-containing protein n=1 Tax=Streptomyces kronopolitis TaxID=1612435 RepID=UPI00342C8E92